MQHIPGGRGTPRCKQGLSRGRMRFRCSKQGRNESRAGNVGAPRLQPRCAALTPPAFHLQERLETIFYSISPDSIWSALSRGRTCLLPPSHKHSPELGARRHRFIYKKEKKGKKKSKLQYNTGQLCTHSIGERFDYQKVKKNIPLFYFNKPTYLFSAIVIQSCRSCTSLQGFLSFNRTFC